MGRILLTIGIAIAMAPPIPCVEAGLGRTRPGLWGMPRAGVVGPSSGLSFSLVPIGYIGSITGTRRSSNPARQAVELSGSLVSSVNVDASVNFLVPQYVYKTETQRVSFSSFAIVPITWLGVTGSLQSSNFSQVTRNANAGMSDLIVSPMRLGIHFSDNNNLAIGTMIFAPTGAFRAGNLSNPGMGSWTIMPNIGHTYMWQKRGLELDNFVGWDIYSRNNNTNYTSGTMFHWDGILIQYLSPRFGFGGIVSNLTQLTKDSGPLAGELRGFEGRAWGAGPIIVHVIKEDSPEIALQFRWVPEFGVTNMSNGTTLLLGITVKLN